jgi:hypothetical protein
MSTHTEAVRYVVVGGLCGPAWAAGLRGFLDPELALTTPRGLWVTLHFQSLFAVLACAATIPLLSSARYAAGRVPAPGDGTRSVDRPHP